MTERKRTYGQWWDTTEELVTVPLEAVRRVGLAGLQAGGATPEDAAFILDIAIDKALQGDHARGLFRLPGMVRSAKRGTLDLHPKITVLRERGATALVGAGPKGQPALVCRFAMGVAIEKAKTHGVGWVGVQAQPGVLGTFVKQAVAQNMVGMVMTQSFPSVAPLGGMKPLLGNAPVAFGVPTSRHDPVIVDLSITESSASGMFQTGLQGGLAPEGALLDELGNPTRDAGKFADPQLAAKGVMAPRGTLTPLGRGHKGYALVFVVGLLAYVLADASPPWDLAPDLATQGTYGAFMVAIDPGVFSPAEDVKGRVDAFIDRVKGAPRKAGVAEILYPGERSQQLQREGREAGLLSLPSSHYHGLVGLAKDLGMEGVL